MKSIYGGRRIVTDAQIARILEWQRTRKTIGDWARLFGVPYNAIVSGISDWTSPEEWNDANNPKKRPGRRRLLSVQQMLTLLEWNRTRRTRAQLARELGLTKSIVGNVVQCRGQYKSCSPEQRQYFVKERRRRLEQFARAQKLAAQRRREPTLRVRALNAERFRKALGIASV